jgi:hypothetical protein
MVVKIRSAHFQATAQWPWRAVAAPRWFRSPAQAGVRLLVLLARGCSTLSGVLAGVKGAAQRSPACAKIARYGADASGRSQGWSSHPPCAG